MEKDIKAKLQDCLTLKNVSERDAVYFLVQIYKLLELHEVKKNFPAIFFYRNWAVHFKIDHDSDFQKWLKEKFREIHLPERQIPGDVFHFGYFDVLAREVISFWQKYINKQEMKTTDRFFAEFRKALLQVIADIPVPLRYQEGNVQLVFKKTGDLEINGPGDFKGEIKFL